ncbi:MAG: acyl carrier protein [candidate division WOR-3 bacterium]|nr:acyl carrier protein [candidate division WOR-3 bacterium]
MSIFERVKKVIVEVLALNEAEVLRESSFENDLGADSLDYVALLQALEEEFNIQIPDEDVPKIKTVEDATKYIESKIKNQKR